MTDKKLVNLYEEALESLGRVKLANELRRLIEEKDSDTENILTIIVNAGVHCLPENLLRGEVFLASEGSLDFSSQESIKKEFVQIVTNVAKKLKEREWQHVYIVPFGPTNLSMLLKLLVYRVTHLDSIDIIYVDGNYHEIEIPIRPVIVEAK